MTGEAGAGGGGNVGGGAGIDGGVDVGRGGGADGEEGATLFLFVTRPSSVASSSSSSSSWTTWGGFPLWFPEDKFLALVGGLGLRGSWAFGWRSALSSGDLYHRVWHGLGTRCQPMGSGERPQFSELSLAQHTICIMQRYMS